MKLFISYYCSFLSIWLLTSCSQLTNNELSPSSSQARFVSTAPAVDKESFKVKAKFIDFEMGDVAHYLFEDEQGEIWDFTTCSDQDFVFEQNLSAEQFNTFNKGWSSNKILQGRWFLLECGVRQQPLYPNGPDDITQVIKDATLLY